MRTLFVLLMAAAAGQRSPAGSVRSQPGTATLETLPSRGNQAEVRTPEGFIRAEGATAGGTNLGAFGVYPAGTYARTAAPPPEAQSGSGGGAVTTQAPENSTPRAAPDSCRRERDRYLRRLLRTNGIDVEDPLALLDGLSGPAGYQSALVFSAYGLLPGVDPLRPLAWDFELQGLARELAACAAVARAGAR